MIQTLLTTLAVVLSTISPVSHRAHIRVRQGVSTNWSGYVVSASKVDDVKSQWVVPTVNCSITPTGYSSAWIGIDGYLDNSVEQLGTEQDCQSGKASYSAWTEAYPKPSHSINLAIRPGDLMSAEVKADGGNRYSVSLKNLTTGQTYQGFEQIHGLRRSAEFIMEAPYSGGILPLADFGQVSFSNAAVTVNGKTGPISNWNYQPITMVNSSGQVKALPSALSSSGFSINWKHL